MLVLTDKQAHIALCAMQEALDANVELCGELGEDGMQLRDDVAGALAAGDDRTLPGFLDRYDKIEWPDR